MKIALSGSDLVNMLATQGEIAGSFARNRIYHLRPVRLLRAGCPKEVCASRENMASGMPIVIEKNRNNYGFVKAAEYYPEAIVVCGADTRSEYLKRGVLNAMAWVEKGLEIHAEDAISCEELCTKLQAQVTMKFYGSAGPINNTQPCPYVVQVYPFENNVIYCMQGQKYRQAFSLEPVQRIVALHGPSVKVDEQFINASEAGMPKPQTGLRTVSAPMPLASNHVSWRGGSTSELVSQVVRNYGSIEEAVSMLLTAIKFGLYKPMVPSFCPVALSPDGKIIQPFVNAGIAPVDVVRWAASEDKSSQHKTVGTGEQVHRSDFAYVGDPSDKSSWKLPIHNASHVRNALSRVNQTKGIPANKKKAVLDRIHRKAKSLGVGTAKEKATPKQKTWVKKGGISGEAAFA